MISLVYGIKPDSYDSFFLGRLCDLRTDHLFITWREGGKGGERGRGEGGVRKWAASGLWKARIELNLFLFPESQRRVWQLNSLEEQSSLKLFYHTHLKLLDIDLWISDFSGLQEHEQLHRSPSGKRIEVLN